MTPNRFERLVSAAEWHSGKTWVVSSVMAVKLLRREHAAVRRMVDALNKRCVHLPPETKSKAMQRVGYTNACADLLAALDARKKGGPR